MREDREKNVFRSVSVIGYSQFEKGTRYLNLRDPEEQLHCQHQSVSQRSSDPQKTDLQP